MPHAHFIPQPHRGVLKISGDERKTFLQGLVSNDVNKLSETQALWSAFLTPQGKFLHEFFMIEHDNALLLEGEAERLEDLRRRLSMYKLRAKITITVEEDLAVYALLGDDLGLTEPGAVKPLAGGVVFADPRLSAAGLRALLPRDSAATVLAEAGFQVGEASTYDRLRLSLGLPDGSRDLMIEKSLLLENGFDELRGVDFQKGCYMGQELTARTKYRGLVRKRLMPVTISGPTPEPGTPLTLDGAEAGEMRSAAGEIGLALVRLEMLDKGGTSGFTAGAATVQPRPAEWMILPNIA